MKIKKYNYLEYVNELMEMGYSEEVATKEADAFFNESYCADDYDYNNDTWINYLLSI